MKQLKQLLVVQDVYLRELEEAKELFSQRQQQFNVAQQQLRELQGYLNDYCDKFNAGAGRSNTINIANYQRFYAQLCQAIDLQQQQLQQLKNGCDSARKTWQTMQAKYNNLEKILQQKNAMIDLERNRKEQKLMDEQNILRQRRRR